MTVGRIEQDLRSALDRLRSAGLVEEIGFPVSPEYEVAAVLWERYDSSTVVFPDVIGHDRAVVGNLLNSRQKLAVACGTPLRSLQPYLVQAYESPQPTTEVADPPCQEIRLTDDFDLATLLPIPKISSRDSGRYITAGLLITRDPVDQRINLAIARLELKGPRKLGCFLARTDTFRFLEHHRQSETPMPVAVAIGNHPVLMAASQMPPPDDELSWAGGLFGEPVEMSRCLTSDLSVPAHAEVVLEGVIDPAVGEPEGPFGEFGGLYNSSQDSPVIEVNAVTMRRNALFQVIVGGTHPEHSLTGVFAREVRLLRALRRHVPNAHEVTFPVGGTGRFQAVVSINDARPGDARTAIVAALNSSVLLRQVVVVDADIDVFDHDQVDWAFASRMDPAHDIVVVEGCRAHPRDPATVDGVAAKVGFDATFSTRTPAANRELPDVPPEVRAAVAQRLGVDTS